MRQPQVHGEEADQVPQGVRAAVGQPPDTQDDSCEDNAKAARENARHKAFTELQAMVAKFHQKDGEEEAEDRVMRATEGEGVDAATSAMMAERRRRGLLEERRARADDPGLRI